MGRIDGTWNLEHSDALRLLSGVEVSGDEVNMEQGAKKLRLIDFFSKIGNAS